MVDVAVVQLDAVPGDVAGNLARLLDAVGSHGPAVDLMVAPELSLTGYDLELLASRGAELAEPADGPSLRRLAQACAEARTTLVVGFLEIENGLLFDSLATLTPDGRTEVYRKTHLYPDELALFAAGDDLRTVRTPAAVLGPMICFEHAFPEVATTLALRGAEILVIPSAVPMGYEHLLSLRTRARAQDNQVFAVACNMAGHGFCGGSLVADPRGEVVVEASAGEGLLHAHIDLAAVQAERQLEPALNMRRPELYTDRTR